jgi:hypothetical protein
MEIVPRYSGAAFVKPNATRQALEIASAHASLRLFPVACTRLLCAARGWSPALAPACPLRSRRVAWDIASPGGMIPRSWMTCTALPCGWLAPAWLEQSLSPDEDADTRGGEDFSGASARLTPHARPREHLAVGAPSAASAWRRHPRARPRARLQRSQAFGTVDGHTWKSSL